MSQYSERLLPFSLCLPFVDPADQVHLIKVFVWFTLISETVTSGAIIVMHVVLVQEVKMISENFLGVKSKQESKFVLVGQLIMVTASNILCWLPANVVYLVSMFLTRYPIDLVVWTTIAVLPLNAIFNPAIFLSVSVRKMFVLRRKERRLETRATESATVKMQCSMRQSSEAGVDHKCPHPD